jgi:polyphosphate:AMP phosphotransferase
MFEAAELGRKVSKEDYDAQLPELRAELLKAQFALLQSNIPVIIIVSGADGAGKGEVVHRLNEWLDPRGIDTHAFWGLSDEERSRPDYWRFWRVLPARGRLAILFGSWYTDPILQKVYGKIKSAKLDAAMERVAFFEKMLVDDGALIVKLWFHITKKTQRKRLEELENDPNSKGRVAPSDWRNHKLYGKFIKVTERVIRRTDSGPAPWHLIEAADRRYRDLTVGAILLQSLQMKLKAAALKSTARRVEHVHRKQPLAGASDTILENVDMTQKLSDPEYKKQLEKYQGKLSRLSWAAWKKKESSVLLFEGWDAAGKGSAIRRVTEAIDPRLYRIIPIAAPTDEERAHHYLWRFWRQIPRDGMVTIYDRSWYGRVLVERVEGFATEAEWMRSYMEITDFEEQLAEHSSIIGKFWIHITKEEQLRRFKAREEVPYKKHKITAEDWRNRKKWDDYEAAVNDMVARTSNQFAPWTLVAGNDKKFARVQILKTICDSLEKVL